MKRPLFSPGKLLPLLAVPLALSQSACVVVGYRGRGGWFMWPGGFGLLVIILLLYLLFGRR